MVERDNSVEFLGVYDRSLDDQRRIIIPKGFIKNPARTVSNVRDIYLQPSKYKGYVLGIIDFPAFMEPQYKETAFDNMITDKIELSPEIMFGLTVRCNLGWGGKLTIPKLIYEFILMPSVVRIIGARTAFYICAPYPAKRQL